MAADDEGLPLLVPEPADPDLMKERISTVLSTAAMVMITVGIVLVLWPRWGGWALCSGGLALALMVGFADAMRKPPPEPVKAKPEPKKLPGPADAGNRHMKGPGAAA